MSNEPYCVWCNRIGHEPTTACQAASNQRFREAVIPPPSGSAMAMREALKPFANISLIRDADPGALNDMIDGPDLAITPKDVRRARAALAVAAPQAQEGEPVAWRWRHKWMHAEQTENVWTYTDQNPGDNSLLEIEALHTSVSRPHRGEVAK